jgi:hypothetical protein
MSLALYVQLKADKKPKIAKQKYIEILAKNISLPHKKPGQNECFMHALGPYTLESIPVRLWGGIEYITHRN